MRRLTLLLVVLIVLPLFAQKAATPAPAPTPAKHTTADARDPGELPVKRVVLYKNGVGYFEHKGHVSGTQELNIQFTTGQLNDVLKSLTVVDLGGGKITGVRYNSIAPLSERLSTLRLQLSEETSREEFLNALRGARVEVRNGSLSAVGRLLSVDKIQKAAKDDTTVEVTQIAVISDSGELRSFEMSPATSVRLVEGELNQEVARYLNLIGSSRAKDLRTMTISSAGTGTRDIFVSYISEVPVWKSTYRIVMPKDTTKLPLLQGWAIVDNTIGEDWKDVQLSLVAGAPQSFVQQISQPLYVRRPQVELPKTAQLTPQTHEVGMDNEVLAGSVRIPPMSQPKAVAGGVGGGIGGGIPRRVMDTPAPPPPSPAQEREDVTTNGFFISGVEPEADGKAMGDLFEYALHDRITVLKNQSALVPIVQSQVSAEKVTLWNEDETQPLRALWLKNTSGLTLDAGTFNVIEGDSFAGEGLLTELRPNERRLISYAADTAVHVQTVYESDRRPVTRVRIAKGLMKLTREERETHTYKLRNTDTQARTVVLEHPARQGWKFVDDMKPEETSSTHYRFKVAVDAGNTTELKVAEMHPLETEYRLTTITDEQVKMFIEQRTISPQLEQAFRRILDKKLVLTGYQLEINKHTQEISRIEQEQSRLRENMRALKGSTEEKALVQRYVQQLNSQEDRLAVLQKELSELDTKRSDASLEIDRMAQEITFDENI